jgi:hypothetical protein
MSATTTGPSTDYNAHDEGIVEAALDAAFAYWDDEAAPGQEPTVMHVTAQVEWAGVVDRARGGVRSTRLDGLNLAALRPALDAARKASQRAERAEPARSYTAKGWHAQLRALVSVNRGSELADRAGLNPTAKTVMAWLSESRAPSAANRARISEAYSGLRTAGVEEARTRAEAANHALAEKLNGVLTEEYGQEIRLRDISRLHLQ